MEDLINRKDAIEWFEPFANKGLVIPVDTVIQNLKDIPSAENKGEWISLHNGKWKCSECGIEVLIYAKGNFCPNCGMRMTDKDIDVPYKTASDQRDYDSTYEPTYNEQDGSM